ncbi:Hsp70 family protein [Candidatus Hodgkinia cicadicola]|uniref:Hsp70 family protein n=1 Tax=Candidatus Hodgkinia cicadicola TaxID=573658 RepID=UPI001788B955
MVLKHLTCNLSRSKLEETVEEFIKNNQTMWNCFDWYNMKLPKSINEIILVGEITRMSKIQRVVERFIW